MSTCISPHGEFGSHELDDRQACTLCGVLDEDALRAELVTVTAERDRLRVRTDRLVAALTGIADLACKVNDNRKTWTTRGEAALAVQADALRAVREDRELAAGTSEPGSVLHLEPNASYRIELSPAGTPLAQAYADTAGECAEIAEAAAGLLPEADAQADAPEAYEWVDDAQAAPTATAVTAPCCKDHEPACQAQKRGLYACCDRCPAWMHAVLRAPAGEGEGRAA